MTFTFIASILGGLIVGYVILVFAGWVRITLTSWRIHRRIFNGIERVSRLILDAGDLDRVPPVVERYLSFAFEEGQPTIRAARLSHGGSLRLPREGGVWTPAFGELYLVTHRVGLIWRHSAYVLGVIPFRTLMSYSERSGAMRGWLLGLITIARGRPDTAAEALLCHYLTLLPLLPTAFLLDSIQWDPIDDTSARATIRDGDRAVSGVFSFDEAGRVKGFERDMPPETSPHADRIAPCHAVAYDDYEEIAGIITPRSLVESHRVGEVLEPYARVEIERLEYDLFDPY